HGTVANLVTQGSQGEPDGLTKLMWEWPPRLSSERSEPTPGRRHVNYLCLASQKTIMTITTNIGDCA
ncbi:MAG: hypothetical protein WA474_03840, partial [Candidatus Sulfotelmatobacter sp.]